MAAAPAPAPRSRRRLRVLASVLLLALLAPAPVRAAADDDAALDAALAEWTPRWTRDLPERYRLDVDRARRLVVASALPEAAHARVRARVAEYADRIVGAAFGASLDAPVMVLVLDARDAGRVAGLGRGRPGRYVHAQRRVMVTEVGVALRHELVHAYHWSAMDARAPGAPRDPLWVQEALGVLFEHLRPAPGDRLVVEPSRRRTVVDNLARGLARGTLDELAAMPAEDFMRRATRWYPLAGTVAELALERGALPAWLDGLAARDPASDPDGLGALARALGVPRDALDETWRTWLRERGAAPEHDESAVAAALASLGIRRAGTGPADAVRLERLESDGPLRRLGARPGDEIVELDGRPTPTPDELARILRLLPPDADPVLLVRRGTAESEATVTRDPGRRRPNGRRGSP